MAFSMEGTEHRRFDGLVMAPELVHVDPTKNISRSRPYVVEDFQDILDDIAAAKPLRKPEGGKKGDKTAGINVPMGGIKIKLEDGRETADLGKGFRRMAAARHWNANNPDDQIEVKIVLYNPKSSWDRYVDNVKENLGRLEMSHVDKAHAVMHLNVAGGGKVSHKDLAKAMGGVKPCSESQIVQYLRLTELPGEIKDMVHTGLLTMENALLIWKVEGDDARIALARKIVAGAVDRVLATASKPEGPSTQVDMTESLDDASAAPTVPLLGSTAPVQLTKAERGKISRATKEAAREAGAKVGRKASELKAYFKHHVDSAGPGSHEGVVQLYAKLLEYMAGDIQDETMDKWAHRICKEKGW